MTHRLHTASRGAASLATPPRPTAGTRASWLRRVVAAALAGTAALIGTLVVAASPAVAGGPTSVLIVNYGQSRASGALTGSTAYENLSRALDAMSEPKGETRSRDDFMSSEIRLTWMIHDVSPWRVDALFLDGKDVWVSTTMSYDGASLFDKPAVWHRPADARLLLATLTSLGVIGALPASATTPQADATAAAAPPARQLAMATPAATVPATGWPWWPAVVAVVAALGLGFAAGRAAGRSSSAGRPGRNDEPLPRRA